MGNEMGNSNTSGQKEEENTAVESAENSAQETNPVDDLKGENQIAPAGEGKDFHEKVEGLSSDDPLGAGDPRIDMQTSDENEQDDTELKSSFQSTEVPIESNDAANQDSESQAVSSPKDMNHLEKVTKPNLEENLLAASDHQIKKQTSTGREEVETSYSTCDTKFVLPTTELLEFVASQSNQRELGEVHAEPLAEGHNGSPSCQAEEKGKLLETEATQNLAETVVSDAKIVEETAFQENAFDTSIQDDKCENATKEELENVLINMTSSFQSGLDKLNEVVTEINLSRNGSSKSPKEAIAQRNSSNTYEEVPQSPDKCMLLTEDMKVIDESVAENEKPIQFHKEAVNEIKTDEVNTSQPELMMVGSDTGNEKESIVDDSCDSAIDDNSQSKEVKVIENGYQLDISNENPLEKIKDSEELTEMASAIETVPTELTVTEYNREEEQLTEKVIENAENLKGETTEQTMPQSDKVDYASSLFSAYSSPLVNLQDQKQDTVIGSETVKSNAVLSTESKKDSCSEFLVIKASIVDSNDSTKQTLVSTVEQSMTVGETETLALFKSAGNEAEESAPRLSTESIPENPSVYSDLRKSPSFDFDLSLGTRSEESDQTPLLHRDKPTIRSLSSRDGKYQSISVVEKTIEVERSDSDKSRGPFLNFLKENEKANVVVKAEKQDCCVDEKKTVALTKGSGKRKPRVSLFSTCICCAAAIN
ncbi:hypothetical protein HYC85_003385 [Camellia sinensis]|uniref:Uncharacterized protein n=1 Tax=Camellia sinensis TaxID=4442 RepID=A0A7J7ICC2_CAMSI|nr:hypothetical protein HYC85_003385 [Camellia sinensis]